MIDFYELLGISMDSTKQEIKTAYREMVKKYHPDVNKSEDSNKIIRSLNEAKEVLLDDEKRKEKYEMEDRCCISSNDLCFCFNMASDEKCTCIWNV